MRNLAQYPITADEVVEVLETMHQDNPPGTDPSAMRIGGINDMIRRGIIEFVTKDENMAALLKKMDNG